MESKHEFIVKSHLSNFDIPNWSIGQYLKQTIGGVIEHDKEQIALIDQETGTKLTYSELDKLASQIALSLLNQNVQINATDCCMFFAENSFDYIVTLLAVTYLGLTVIPIAPSYGPYELYQQLSETNAKLFFIGESKLSVLKRLLKNENFAVLIKNVKLLVILDQNVDKESAQDIIQHPHLPSKVINFSEILLNTEELSQIPNFEVDPKVSPYLIMYTSGSSGKPKGVIHSHRSFLSCLLVSTGTKQIIIGGITNLNFPFGHMSGCVMLWQCLSIGQTLVIFSKPATSEIILAAVEKYCINNLLLSATLSVDLLKNDYFNRYNLSSVKKMLFGGSKFPENIALGLIAKYNVKIRETYGATEFMCPLKNFAAYQPGNLGSPNPNVEMKVIDCENGQSLPAGAKGEILFRGTSCFIGYAGNAEATRKAIDIDRWYHTGDIGYYDESGSLRLIDRLNELIKYKYFSVAAAEVETFLMTHEAIKEVCVVGVKHATEGYHARAYVQLVEGKCATEEEIVKFAQDNIGYHNWLNGGVCFVVEMPHVSIGKINRQFFKQLVKDEILTALAPEYK